MERNTQNGKEAPNRHNRNPHVRSACNVHMCDVCFHICDVCFYMREVFLWVFLLRQKTDYQLA